MTTTPSGIKLHRKSGVLEISFAEQAFELSSEYLRVYSPSAEVRGHGAGQEVLQFGKAQVLISKIEPVGNYAIKITFDDQHDSGVYSWEYLRYLGENYESLWPEYLEKLKAANKSREPDTQVIQLIDPKTL